MGLTTEQESAAYASRSVAVTAGAGTGKTHMLTERYLHFLRDPQGFSPLQMVAVTFTEKAATELKSRIRQSVTQEMGNRLEVLAELEAAQISTFHALAARICQEHPERANVPPDFMVQDAIESSLWQAEHFDRAIAQLPAHLYQTVPFSVMQSVLQALLADPLTAEQALDRNRADWLPALETFRKALLAGISKQTEWASACAVLNQIGGPLGDKREIVRAEAWAIASAFNSIGDIADLEALTKLSLAGGSKQRWPDPENFDAVKDAVNALKQIAKAALKVLQALVPTEYDDLTEAMLPAIREAIALVRGYLQDIKYQQRILDFNDLEVHALKALSDPAVAQYYALRWKVFLIDEFQDTNPTQGKLLELLTASATVTIVGDRKQSIYGFRRADTAVFQQWQNRIHPSASTPVELSESFRTHRTLMDQINQVFAPVLADMHQPLTARRQEGLLPIPEIQLYTVVVVDDQDKNDALDTNIDACRLVEAQKIADLVQAMLIDEPIQVHDKASNRLRPIEPRDIAILGRIWGPLELYSNALSARGIPVLQAGGGSLLDTREAKDAIALLRFLADPTDALALAAVLRSPFFAISDLTLYAFAQSLPEKTSWWKHLRDDGSMPELARPKQVLGELLGARRVEAPTRLLQMGDRLTGYTAVTANLPGAARRMADWNGAVELVRSLEQGNFDVLAVVRRLKQINSAKVALPRPAVEGGNAVSLMTIHGSKGLEWPVVFIPDLSHRSQSDSPLVRFDAALGVALKLSDKLGDPQKSAFYTLLEQQKKAAEKEESKRVFYVALTRARDRLMLTAASTAGGGLALPSPFRRFHVPNISPDMRDGIGAWTLADFSRAMTTGVSPRGAHYYPSFPYTSYRLMPAQDVGGH
ncbi:MAG: UvrD-helicase domain-containing protein, partial [Phormidesmis sp. RL_2_1]|nr:UvrD-helicase domain-containing protein [Phormidesmis sp. RL_2_1]